MTQQVINVGLAPNDGLGDPIRTAFVKCNDNFTQLYSYPNPTPPTTLVGKVGDLPGMYAYDSAYFYYCYDAYDGVSVIWAQIAQVLGEVTHINNGTSNVDISFDNANVTVSVNGVSNVAVFSPQGLAVANNLSANTFTANSFVANVVIGNNISVNSVTSGNITIAGDSITSVWNTISILPTTPGQVEIGGNTNIQGNVTLTNSLYVGTRYIVVANAAVDGPSANLSGLYVGSGDANAFAYLVYKNSTNEWFTHQNIFANANIRGNNGNFVGMTVGILNVNDIVANTLSGNGYTITETNGSNVIGPVGNAISSSISDYAANAGIVLNPIQTAITTVGTLGTLTVAGGISAGNITTTGNVRGGNITSPGNISTPQGVYATFIGGSAATILNGTLGVPSNSQPNITQVGTLTSLNLAGDMVSNGNAYFTGDIFAGNINANISGYTQTAQFVTGNNQSNITGVGNLVALRVIGNIYSDGSIRANSIGYPGNVGNTTLYGNIGFLSNAQPNITSVGNLVSVTVRGSSNLGNINITGNVIAGEGTNDIYLDPQFDGSPGTGTVHVLGNLNVQGTTTTINSNVVAINDLVFVVANNASNISLADGAGIAVGPDPVHYAQLTYDAVTNSWVSSNPLTVIGNVTSTGFNWSNGSPVIASNGSATFSTVAATGNISTTGNINTAGITSTGNITAPYFIGTATQAEYADLAECYLADADYEPGTVLKFGGTQEVTVSNVDMDQLIAGVVSTKPAHLMNSQLKGENVISLALTGRVPCKVTGMVTPGAMMVSNGDGTARAEATPVIGSVIGKAVQGFIGKEGTIEIVVGRL